MSQPFPAPDRLPPAPWMSASATRRVLAALQAQGGPTIARFVGGCVRDTLLGRAGPDVDIDIATPMHPPAVMAALERAGLRAAPTGIAHGVVTAIAEGRPFEIATLRRDVATDGRRAVVAFSDDWAEDAQRRDFRLNALYAEPEGRLHDPTGGGIADALAGRIVFVGDPNTRIREDYLRILRFFRFHAGYGRGEADAAAVAACAALRGGLAGLSGERVARELLKLLIAPDPGPAVRLMAEAGVLAEVVPAADPARLEALLALERAEGWPTDAVLRLSAMLPAEPAAAALAARLKLANAVRDRLTAAVPAWNGPIDPAAVRRVVHGLGAPAAQDRLRLAWSMSGGAPAAWRAAAAVAGGWRPPSFPVSGDDIKALGVAEGPQVGRLHAELERIWIAEDFAPDREALLDTLQAIVGQGPRGGSR